MGNTLFHSFSVTLSETHNEIQYKCRMHEGDIQSVMHRLNTTISPYPSVGSDVCFRFQIAD